MALLNINYYSKALKKRTPVNVILPEKAKTEKGAGIPEVESYKTLYLLHGLSGDHTDWVRWSRIETYASQYGIAVVMPEVGRTWYTDTSYDENYFTFVAEELPEVCRGYFKGMSSRREDNMVAGLSMGGYGALKIALSRPDKFGYCASLSGSLDVTRKGRTVDMPMWRGVFDFDLKDPMELKDSCHDLFALARKNSAAGNPFPKLYIWCGTEDVLIKINREYRDLLNELGVEHCYEEGEGDHTWPWWDLHIQDALKYLLG